MRSKPDPVDQPERTAHYDCAMCIAEMLHNTRQYQQNCLCAIAQTRLQHRDSSVDIPLPPDQHHCSDEAKQRLGGGVQSKLYSTLLYFYPMTLLPMYRVVSWWTLSSVVWSFSENHRSFGLQCGWTVQCSNTRQLRRQSPLKTQLFHQLSVLDNDSSVLGLPSSVYCVPPIDNGKRQRQTGNIDWDAAGGDDQTSPQIDELPYLQCVQLGTQHGGRRDGSSSGHEIWTVSVARTITLTATMKFNNAVTNNITTVRFSPFLLSFPLLPISSNKIDRPP